MKIYFNLFLIASLFLVLLAGCKSQQASVSQATPAAVIEPHPTTTAAELAGNWDYAMTNKDGTITGTLAIRKGGSVGYTGWIKVKEMGLDAETIISKAELKGTDFIYNGQVKTEQGNYPFEIYGTIAGDKLTGEGKLITPQGSTLYKVSANRK